MSSSMGISSLPTTLPSSVESLQLLQEQAALQLLMRVRSSVSLVRCCTVRGRSTGFGVFTRPPRVQYNRSCAIDRDLLACCNIANYHLPTVCWYILLSSVIVINNPCQHIINRGRNNSIATSSLTESNVGGHDIRSWTASSSLRS